MYWMPTLAPPPVVAPSPMLQLASGPLIPPSPPRPYDRPLALITDGRTHLDHMNVVPPEMARFAQLIAEERSRMRQIPPQRPEGPI